MTSIGTYAFYGCSSLTTINIPTGVTSIGERTFFNCSSLENIVIPDGVTSIGDAAFRACSALKSIIIPDGVTSINTQTFYGCSSLESIVIPDGVTSIGDTAFYNCSSLSDAYYCGKRSDWATVTIGSSNTELESATIHYAPTTTPALAWDGESFGINFDVTDGWADTSYAANFYANGATASPALTSSFTTGGEGFTLVPSGTNNKYQLVLSNGYTTSVSPAAGVYGLVAQALANGGFSGENRLNHTQLAAINTVLANGGIYITDDTLNTEAALLMSYENGVITINEDLFNAGLKFSGNVRYTLNGGAEALSAEPTNNGRTLDLSVAALGVSVIFLSAEELEFVPDSITEVEASDELSVLDFEEIL